MSWDELDDEATLIQTVEKHSVVLRTRDRVLKGKTLYHYFKLTLGTDVLKKLKWKKDTTVKFLWGKDEHLGLLKIAPVLTGSTIWKIRFYANNSGSIVNKVLPKDIVKSDRNLELTYRIVTDPRSQEYYNLEIKLPDDFYINNAGAQVKFETPIVQKNTAQKPEVVAPEIPKINKPVKVPIEPEDNSYMSQGGFITLEQLCKYVRIGIGDRASVISGDTVEFNGNCVGSKIVLDYANQERGRKKLPLFYLKK